MLVLLAVLAVLGMCAARPHESTSAHLLVLKSVDQDSAVVRKNLTVSINVFNIGKSPAFDITIDDSEAGDAAGVSLVEGTRTFTIDKIPAGENRTHTYVVNPLLAGTISYAPAKVAYKLEPRGEVTNTVVSNALHSVPVLTSEEHARLTATHVKEWVIFSVLSLGLVLAPYTVYNTAAKNLRA
jgi:hypothetical protein